MNDQEINRLSALAGEFLRDRRMEGYADKSEERALWALDYFTAFLRGRDEDRLEDQGRHRPGSIIIHGGSGRMSEQRQPR